MTDLEFMLRKMCQRRNATMTKVESVALSTRIEPATLADLTALLPALASTFYFIENLQCGITVAITGGNFLLRGTNTGQGSAGNFDLLTNSVVSVAQSYTDLECDSLIYVKNGTTGGSARLWAGKVFKVTFSL